MMRQFIIRCLKGTSSNTMDIQITAPNLSVAMQACREYGFLPVQHCLIYSS